MKTVFSFLTLGLIATLLTSCGSLKKVRVDLLNHAFTSAGHLNSGVRDIGYLLLWDRAAPEGAQLTRYATLEVEDYQNYEGRSQGKFVAKNIKGLDFRLAGAAGSLANTVTDLDIAVEAELQKQAIFILENYRREGFSFPNEVLNAKESIRLRQSLPRNYADTDRFRFLLIGDAVVAENAHLAIGTPENGSRFLVSVGSYGDFEVITNDSAIESISGGPSLLTFYVFKLLTDNAGATEYKFVQEPITGEELTAVLNGKAKPVEVVENQLPDPEPIAVPNPQPEPTPQPEPVDTSES